MMMEFIEVFNKVASLVKNGKKSKKVMEYASSMDEKLTEIDLDSLDYIMAFVYFADIYGVPEEDAKRWSPKTVQELHDLVMAGKTREPGSMEELVEYAR
jgi:hypothetical protein